MNNSHQISLRPPTTLHLIQSPTFTPPSIDWLFGTWHVTHSTLPMWKSKRNVTIAYKPLYHAADAPSTVSKQPASATKLEDIVSYQTLSSAKRKTILGIDTVGKSTGEWNWRGKGWLMIASSHWEVLGWGDLDGGGKWAVTYFAKTAFTPAGIDLYAWKKEGNGKGLVEEIKAALRAVGNDAISHLATELFEVARN